MGHLRKNALIIHIFLIYLTKLSKVLSINITPYNQYIEQYFVNETNHLLRFNFLMIFITFLKLSGSMGHTIKGQVFETKYT